VTVGLALIFIVGGLVGLIPGAAGRWLYRLMPGNAGSQIVGFGEGARSRDARALAPWPGFWVFVVEIAVLLLIGAVLFDRRDA
jgi:ABC-2 type transport system permease protein